MFGKYADTVIEIIIGWITGSDQGCLNGGGQIRFKCFRILLNVYSTIIEPVGSIKAYYIMTVNLT